MFTQNTLSLNIRTPERHAEISRGDKKKKRFPKEHQKNIEFKGKKCLIQAEENFYTQSNYQPNVRIEYSFLDLK